MAVIALAVLTWRTWSSNNEIKHQVKNDHKTNLREDIDGVSDKLDKVLFAQRKTAADIEQIRVDVYTLQLREDSFDTTQQKDKADLQKAIADRNAALEELRRDIPRIMEAHCAQKGCDTWKPLS